MVVSYNSNQWAEIMTIDLGWLADGKRLTTDGYVACIPE
jgi:hypothetical protein